MRPRNEFVRRWRGLRLRGLTVMADSEGCANVLGCSATANSWCSVDIRLCLQSGVLVAATSAVSAGGTGLGGAGELMAYQARPVQPISRLLKVSEHSVLSSRCLTVGGDDLCFCGWWAVMASACLPATT